RFDSALSDSLAPPRMAVSCVSERAFGFEFIGAREHSCGFKSRPTGRPSSAGRVPAPGNHSPIINHRRMSALRLLMKLLDQRTYRFRVIDVKGKLQSVTLWRDTTHRPQLRGALIQGPIN